MLNISNPVNHNRTQGGMSFNSNNPSWKHFLAVVKKNKYSENFLSQNFSLRCS
jgi:hypothetical protein